MSIYLQQMLAMQRTATDFQLCCIFETIAEKLLCENTQTLIKIKYTGLLNVYWPSLPCNGF